MIDMGRDRGGWGCGPAVSGRASSTLKLLSKSKVERRLILLAVERAGSSCSEKSSLISSRACETRRNMVGLSIMEGSRCSYP